jgi:HlyD family secretion protein
MRDPFRVFVTLLTLEVNDTNLEESTAVASLSNRTLLKPIRTLFNVGSIGEQTDGQLLERFATDPSEVAELAFAVLVERHGPMVFRVCRSLLPDVNDAHDAFQATFLVLVQKARLLWVQDSIGPWLHQVAYRTAWCARVAAARRHKHEHQAAVLRSQAIAQRNDEPALALHEEIARLPEYFRVPVVLCDLEGRSHDQAARHLGVPLGTVKSRLRRGRERLRERLIKRGVGSDWALPSAGALCRHWNNCVPAALTESTSRLALESATAGVPLSGPAVVLARGILRAMAASAGAKVALCLLILGAAAGVAAGLAHTESGRLEGRLMQPVPPTRRSEIPLHEVKPGTLRMAASAPGFIRAARSVPVRCELEVDTKILSIVPDGTTVKTGQVVCELDTSEALWDAVSKQQVVCIAAEADYENAKNTLEVAEIAVKEAEAIVQTGDPKRKAELLEPGKRPNQKTLEDFKVAEARSRGDAYAKHSTSRLEQAKLEQLNKKVPKYTIHARGPGILVHENDPTTAGSTQIGKGKSVRRGQWIFSIHDIHQPKHVTIKLAEPVAYHVHSGMQAEITVDALAGAKLGGFVDSVAPAPEPQQQVSLTRPREHVVSITIRTANPELRPGMLARVEILIAKLDNVLAVPLQAIVRYDGKDHLAVKKPDGSFDWREVVLGVEADKEVEVKRGVQAGDLVALKPLDVLRQGRINDEPAVPELRAPGPAGSFPAGRR